MAIREVRPEVFEREELVRVFSDAPDNETAIREIEQWASQNGFRRTREYHLDRVRIGEDRCRCHVGICHRIDEEYRKAAEEDLKSIRQRRESMPRTKDSDALLKEGG